MLQAINAKVGLGGEKHARDEAPAEEEEEQGGGGGGNRRERRKKQKGAAVQKSTVAGGLDLFGGGGEGGRGAPKGVGFGKGGNEYDEYFPDAGEGWGVKLIVMAERSEIDRNGVGRMKRSQRLMKGRGGLGVKACDRPYPSTNCTCVC